MQSTLELKPIHTVECDAAILVAFEGQAGEGLPDIVKELYESKEFSGKSLEVALLHRPPGMKAKRLLLVGGGKSEKFTSADLRKAAGAAVRHLKSKSLRSAAMLLEGSHASADHVEAALEGAILGDFDPDALKSEKKNGGRLEQFTVLVPGEIGRAHV